MATADVTLKWRADMIVNRIEYSYVDNRVYGIPEGETAPVELVWTDDSTGFELHPSEVWARAEQALLQEQRDAQLAAERAEALFHSVHSVLATLIPRLEIGAYGWVGTHVVAQHIIRDLQDKGYIQ